MSHFNLGRCSMAFEVGTNAIRNQLKDTHMVLRSLQL